MSTVRDPGLLSRRNERPGIDAGADGNRCRGRGPAYPIGGNPRCLDALLRTGRPFDGPALGTGTGQLAAGAALDALIRQEIEAAEHRAIEKGATERDVCALLAGLALLPPPVPGGELAAMPSAENRGTIGGGVAEAKALTFPAARGRRSGEPGLSPRSWSRTRATFSAIPCRDP